MKQALRRPWFWLVLAVLVLGGVWLSRSSTTEREEIPFNEYEDLVADGEVVTATIGDRDNSVTGELRDGTGYRVVYVNEFGDELLELLSAADPAIDVAVDQQAPNQLVSLLFSLLPIAIIIGAFIFLIGRFQGGGRAMSFGRSKAKPFDKSQTAVTFDDVAGADEAVEELREIKEFLESPRKFQAVGARIPKGVLLYGPPGTGKTLLARAVAGEAGVPFYSISGSDFVEMFVGVGASRVRDLFEQAKDSAPAIIFVDEIDAVGRHRGAGLGGGHDEREQTLNQLLVEMDGFDASTGVILIAGTNRPDILDPALLRPGRFDRQIVIDRPDLRGREQILTVHAKGKPLAADVDLRTVAKRTPGFTGADLANLLNEAALLTARQGGHAVTAAAISDAIDRVMAGAERKTRILTERDKLTIAYHEGGHALVGHVLPNTDPIHKVSIISRGRALGWTLALPDEDRVLRSRSQLVDEMAMLLGGRTAEQLIFGDPTTGAANDIERVTEIARSMVTEFGMSDGLGPRKFGNNREEVFLGKDMAHEPNYSDSVAAEIDREISELLGAAQTEAMEILTQHRAILDRLADALVENETIERDELLEIFGDLEPWDSASLRSITGGAIAAQPESAAGAYRSTDKSSDQTPGSPPFPKDPEIS